MGFSVSTPASMYQSPSGYIFRPGIPNDLRTLVGKSEFRYSLRPGILHLAKQRASCVAANIQRLFIGIRTEMSEWTSERIIQAVMRYIKETLTNDEKCRQLKSITIRSITDT